MIEHFHGATAVITGAGSGLGLACAREAAERGMNLVLADVQADALQAAATELRAAGCTVLAQTVDVADAQAMERFAAQVQQHCGAPQLVLNNAGVGAGGLIWENSLQDWQWVLGVNLWGVIHGVRLFTPMMLAAAQADPAWRGHIVNTASMAGLLNAPNLGAYNVTKHAVVSLSETLYQDLALVSTQVGASVLCPYFVPTAIDRSERNRPQDGTAPLSRSQQVNQAMVSKAVASGKVSAEDVARQVFAAVASGQFYIFSHPQLLAGVRQRLEDVLAARNPSDPFADKPALGAQLRVALGGIEDWGLRYTARRYFV